MLKSTLTNKHQPSHIHNKHYSRDTSSDTSMHFITHNAHNNITKTYRPRNQDNQQHMTIHSALKSSQRTPYQLITQNMSQDVPARRAFASATSRQWSSRSSAEEMSCSSRTSESNAEAMGRMGSAALSASRKSPGASSLTLTHDGRKNINLHYVIQAVWHTIQTARTAHAK